MNKYLRMLMMFGPMIFRQYQKYQQNKARQQSAQKPSNQTNREQQSNRPPNNVDDKNT